MTAILTDNGQADEVGPGSDDEFVYTTDSGDTVTLPSLSKPFKTAGELREHRKDTPLDLAYYVIERDSDPAQLKIIDGMPFEEFQGRFAKAWQAHSGVGVGESQAS